MRIGLVCTAALAFGFFAVRAVAENPLEVVGDPAAGSGTYAKTCIFCHGVGGNSVVPAQPIIAGQHAEYLREQLMNFKSGARKNAIMGPMAQKLSEQDIANVAAFLTTQKAGLAGATDPKLAAKGEKLYRLGRPEDGVGACIGCHGPTGSGIPPHYPVLSGQHAEYLRTTLSEFRSGARKNDIMNITAARLSDADIRALAEFLSGLY